MTTNKERLDAIEIKLDSMDLVPGQVQNNVLFEKLETIEKMISAINIDGIKQIFIAMQEQIDSLASRIPAISESSLQKNADAKDEYVGIQTNDFLGGDAAKPMIEGEDLLDEQGHIIPKQNVDIANATLPERDLEYSIKEK